MQRSDVLFFTSVAEGTPHAVLEAISNRLPVVCFDCCGQGDSVNEKVGIKIKLSNPQQSINEFAEKIEHLYHHREELTEMSENCLLRQKELSWENKAKQMTVLYNQAIKK
jgi:glycosyltransferase involved in cell wall biosynthesis